MTENPSHELATPEEWSRARHRETILRSLVTQSSLSETDIRLASKRMGVGRAYFYRLLAAYRLRPQTSTLLPRAGGRPSGLHLLPARTESLIHKCIEEFYMSRVRPSFAALTRRITHECRRVEVPTPNYRTIRRRLSTYDPKELSKARFGAKAAGEEFRPVRANTQPALPFQLLQIDHSPMDLIVLDERDRLPIGRPWISLAIDVATRSRHKTISGGELPLVGVVANGTRTMLKRAAISATRMLSTAYFVGLGTNSCDFTFAGVGQ